MIKLLTGIHTLRTQIIWFIISVVIYYFIIGLHFTIVLILVMMWHELCHLFVARTYKLRTSGIVFLPFIGAAALIAPPKSCMTNAICFLAGPIGGFLLSCIGYLFYVLTGQEYFSIIAYYNCVFNLLNLVPVSILDGGRAISNAMEFFSPKVNILYKLIFTIIVSFGFFYYKMQFMGTISLALGSKDTWQSYLNYKYLAQGQVWMVKPYSLLEKEKMNKQQVAAILFTWLMATIALSFICYLGINDPIYNISYVVKNYK